MKVKVTQLCLTLCDPMDYTVHGILQARILEWVAFPFSRGSSQPRDQTQISCTAGGLFMWLKSKALIYTHIHTHTQSSQSQWFYSGGQQIVSHGPNPSPWVECSLVSAVKKVLLEYNYSHSFTYCLWLLSCYHDRVIQLQQKPYD